MRRAGSESWTITWDFPYELQLCAYIGRQEGFSAADGAVPATPAEAAWRAWWDAVAQDNFEVRLARLRRERPGAAPLDLARESRALDRFDPPEFAHLGHAPALQALCRAHWPTFHDLWDNAGGDKMSLADSLGLQIQRLHLNRLVADACHAAGKRAPSPFALRVDIVIWPLEYQRILGDAHLVLGRRYLSGGDIEQLRALLAAHLVRLV